MKKCLAFFCFIFLSLSSPVYADYVLPYPSYMPGNKLYQISRALDILSQWWYWGNIASVKYHLKLADKYIVEAKTLFEYRQYLLANNALDRSNKQFQMLHFFIERAQREGKDTKFLQLQVREATQKHINILERLKDELPKEFIWIPEKTESITLHIFSLLNSAIEVRRTMLLNF